MLSYKLIKKEYVILCDQKAHNILFLKEYIFLNLWQKNMVTMFKCAV
jgi:hypothetical protein